jgi:carbonic anhydrase
MVSIENLMTFPFVQGAVEKGELTLHGLWTDIAEGTLEQFDVVTQNFVKI